MWSKMAVSVGAGWSRTGARYTRKIILKTNQSVRELVECRRDSCEAVRDRDVDQWAEAVAQTSLKRWTIRRVMNRLESRSTYLRSEDAGNYAHMGV
jgi:hypothetical protein